MLATDITVTNNLPQKNSKKKTLMQYKITLLEEYLSTYLPQGSETSQTGCSLYVDEGVHLLEFGGLFPAPVSSIAEKKYIIYQNTFFFGTPNGSRRFKAQF